MGTHVMMITDHSLHNWSKFYLLKAKALWVLTGGFTDL